MVQKICPICDGVMKSAHYCKNCKSWVKTPSIREVSYRLNEGHPREETDCSYHGMPGRGKNGATETSSAAGDFKQFSAQATKSPTPLPNQNWTQDNAGAIKQRQAQTTFNSTPTRNAKPARSLSPRLWVYLIIGFMMVANLIAGAYRYVSNQIMEIAGGVLSSEGYDFDLGDFSIEENPYVELGDEEVIEAGEACNSRDHFPVSGESLKTQVITWLEGCGYRVETDSINSYNERYESGETWYNTWVTLWVEKEGQLVSEDTYQYLDVDYDTATGELHQISADLADLDDIGTITTSTLEWLYQQLETEGENDNGVAGIVEEVMASLEAGENYVYEGGGLQIFAEYYEDVYCVTIRKSLP